ncbi:tRNA uracil 4-sulfurtransferase ThiI [Galenea microaerophila]
MKFVVKLFPEIMVKGNAVKKKMVAQLHHNLRTLLNRVDEQIEVKRFWDKIEVQCDASFHAPVAKVLRQTPGVDQVLEVLEFPFTTQEEIAEIVVQQMVERIEDKTFVVRVKRSGEHDFTSNELERFVGAALYRAGNPKGVDIKHAEVVVQLEVTHQQLYIVTDRYPGLGGFPLGMQGDVLSLMSGGFDSTVASFLTIKRGMKTHFIFFNLGGDAHEIGVKQVAFYLWRQYAASHRVQFITLPFEKVIAEMFNSIHESYLGVMLKRLMLKAAEQVADEMGIDALVTGESVAQVSSQTLRNLALIDEATSKLVLRPLVTMNKNEIIQIAEEIGTRHFAENMPEYCGVISKNPVTHGSFKRLPREEARFDFSVLEEAVANRSVVPVDQIITEINQKAAVPIVNQVTDEVVIDIRSESEKAQSPLDLASETIEIPFYELNQKFKQLDQDKQYLLYCEKGVMSQLHAQYLIDQGFNNLKVYRPEA